MTASDKSDNRISMSALCGISAVDSHPRKLMVSNDEKQDSVQPSATRGRVLTRLQTQLVLNIVMHCMKKLIKNIFKNLLKMFSLIKNERGDYRYRIINASWRFTYTILQGAAREPRLVGSNFQGI